MLTVEHTRATLMYLVTPDILINESRLTKFGWEVGTLVLFIARQPQPGERPLPRRGA